ncbi:hypothetical protein D3C81_1195000 [compost metagenome]
MDQWSNMETAFYASIFTVILGGIFYFKLWWDGPGVGWKFTRWFFAILLVVTLVVGVCTYFMS